MTEKRATILHYDNALAFQNVMFKYFKDKFTLSLVKCMNSIDSRKTLNQIMDYLEDEEILLICEKLNLPVPDESEFDKAQYYREGISYIDIIIEILYHHLIA